MGKRHAPAGSWSVKLLVAAVVVASGALIGWGLLAGRNEAAIEAQHEGRSRSQFGFPTRTATR